MSCKKARSLKLQCILRAALEEHRLRYVLATDHSSKDSLSGSLQRGIKIMTVNRIKVLATLSVLLPVLALTVFYRTTQTVAAVAPTVADAAATYKTKCAMCHSPKAEKLYDNPAAPIEEQVEAVLKGKKGKKPPDMPAFGAKGMTADEAKQLVEYMQELRKPAS
jgi:mono/diheme cytochrome c family protein